MLFGLIGFTSIIHHLKSILNKIECSKLFLRICLLIAISLRVAWLYAVSPEPVSDFRWYYERGQDMAAGYGYSMQADDFWPENISPAALTSDNGRRFTAYWPVGYPAFLGLLFFVFGPSILAVQVANLFLYTGVLLLAYHTAKRLFQSELTGRLTLLFLAFYPDHIFYTTLLATEILFLFLLLLGILLLLLEMRLRWAVVTGVVWGVICLIKPQTMLIPVIVLAGQWLTDTLRNASTLNDKSKTSSGAQQGQVLRYLKYGGVLYLTIGLIILPWTFRNFRVFKNFVFVSTNGGYNLLMGNNPYASGTYGASERLTEMLGDVADERARDVRARHLALTYIVDHPWQTVKRWPKKLWFLYRQESVGLYWNQQGVAAKSNKIPFHLLMRIAQGYYALIITFFLVALLFFLQIHLKARPIQMYSFPFLVVGIIVYFTFLSLLTFADGRFHFPIILWMIMLIGAGLTTLFGLIEKD